MDSEIQDKFEDIKNQAQSISRKGDIEEALRLLDKAESQAAALDEPLALALVLRGRANVYQYHTRSKESLRAAQKAVTIYEQHGTPFDVALAQTVSVISLNVLERYAEAIALAEQIEPHFVNFPLGLTKLNTLLASIYEHTGQYEKALTYYEQSINFYHETDDYGEVARIFNNMGVIAQKMDDFPLAHDYFTQAYPLYKKVGYILGMVKTKSNLAKLYIRQNQLQTALKYLDESRQVIKQLPDSPDNGRLDLFEARVRRLLNQPQEAKPLLQAAYTRFVAVGWKTQACEALIELAHLLSESENPADLMQALTYMEQAETYLQSLAVPLLVAQVQLEQAELLLRLERMTDARPLAQAAQVIFAEAGLDLREAQAKIIRGDCIWKLEPEQAKALYLDALNTSEMNSPLLASHCWLGLGRIALAKQMCRKLNMPIANHPKN